MKRPLLFVAFPWIAAAGVAAGNELHLESSAQRSGSALTAGARASGAESAESSSVVTPRFARNTTVLRDREGHLHLALTYVLDLDHETVGGHFSQGAVDQERYFNHLRQNVRGDSRRLEVGGSVQLERNRRVIVEMRGSSAADGGNSMHEGENGVDRDD